MAGQVVWRPVFQQTIDAFHAGDLAAGQAACDRVLALAGVPAEYRVHAARNAVFYARPLAELVPGTALRPVEVAVEPGWSRYNPSLCADPAGDGFRMVLRSANYTVTSKLDYATTDPDGVVRTVNRLVALDRDLNVTGVELIDDREATAGAFDFPVAGLEDLRLFPDGGGWSVVATTRQQNPDGWCQQLLARLDGATLREPRLLSAPGRHEKNWMPVVGAAEPTFVYLCRPTTVLRATLGEPPTAVVVERPGPLVAERFRGGSQAVPFDGGHLCLVHETADFDDGVRIYLHRFVWFDAEWALARCSRPFVLRARGIEFAAGLAIRGEEAVVAFGEGDRETWLATVPLVGVRSLLLAPEPDGVAVDEDDEPAGEEDGAEDEEAAAADEGLGYTPFPVLRPSIVSTTLAGNNEAIVGDALRSVVDWVDACLLLDTGITDRTLEVAREVAGAKLVVERFPWVDDFAAARNAALAAAARLGHDWAVTLDTDERIDRRGTDVRAALAATPHDTLMVAHVGETYEKERFFRLPARGEFVGPTHEAFVNHGWRGSLPGPVFDEAGKDDAGYRRKFERDVAILERHTAAHPDDPRWWYYLGDSLANLGRHEEAVVAFERCWALRGWDEEGAWAMYRAANAWVALGRPEKAVEAAAAGMARHAEMAELPWLAAYAAWRQGEPAQAVRWARIAADLGVPWGRGRPEARAGFKHPPALWEGPWDVLRFALRELGDHAGADEAERRYHEALARRGVPGHGPVGEDDEDEDDEGEEADPGPPLALERVLRVGPGDWELQGTLRGGTADLGEPRVPLPDGGEAPLEDAALWRETRDDRPALAFGARLRVAPGREPQAWLLRGEVGGEAVEAACPDPPEEEPRRVVDRLLAPLDPADFDAAWQHAPRVAKRVAPVQRALAGAARVVADQSFGEPPAAPRATVVVPLHRELGYLPEQVARFAADPAMAGVELLYAVDGPEHAPSATERLGALHAEHGLPLRVLATSANAGFSRINNLAAAAARGSRLVFLNSDAWPQAPGWLDAVVAPLAEPGVGLVSPTLWYPDGRFQGGGNAFSRREHPPCWNWAIHDRSEADRAVEGLPGACLAADRAWFLALGGFDERMVVGEFDDCDLSLVSLRLGLENRQLAGVHVTHAESASYRPGEARVRRWLHNARVFNDTWGRFLDLREAGWTGDYFDVLAMLHRVLRPEVYLEIGVEHGFSLALARRTAIGVDPEPQVDAAKLGAMPDATLVRQTSDAFFAGDAPRELLGERRVGLAFVDGLHLAEQVVRDIANVERWMAPGGVVAIHDVVPPDAETARRQRQQRWWTGDVWKVVPLLRRLRPDLRLRMVSNEEAPPIGLLLVTNLDPTNDTLHRLSADEIAALQVDDDGTGLAAYLADLETVPLLDALLAISAEAGGGVG